MVKFKTESKGFLLKVRLLYNGKDIEILLDNYF